MAELTETLPTITQSFEETIAPVKPAPSFLETIADFGSNALQAVEQGNVVSARRAAAERQRRKDALDASDRAAENEAAGAAGELLINLSGADLAAAEDAANVAEGLVAQQDAAQQGRGLSPEQGRLKIATVIRAGLARHPNSRAAFLKTLKEYGVIDPLIEEMNEAEAKLDAQEEAIVKREEEDKDYAQNKLGINVDALSPVEWATVVRPKVHDAKRNETMLEQMSTQATIRSQQANISEKEREFVEKETSKNTLSALIGQTEGVLYSARQSIALAIASGAPEAEIDRQISEAIRVLGPTADLIRDNSLAQYGQQLSASDKQAYIDHIDRIKSSMTEMLTGPASVVATQKRQVEILESALGIKGIQAMPMWSELKARIGSSAALDIFLTDVLSNPKLLEGVRREFNGMGDTLGPNESRVRLNNLMEYLSGNFNYHDFSQQEARSHANSFLSQLIGSANNPDIVSGKDAAGKDVAYRAAGGVANVLIEAVPMWGVGDLVKIGGAAALNGVKILGTEGGDPDLRVRTINAYQPGLQKVYHALRDAPTGDKFYDVVWNAGKGAWEAKRNGTPAMQQSPQSMARFGNLRPNEPQISDAVRKKVNVMNTIIEAQASFARAGFDPDLKGVDLTNPEIKEYYARGVIPQSLKEARKQEKQKSTDQSGNIQEIVTSTLKTLGSLEFTPPSTEGLKSPEEIRTEFGDNENLPKVEEAAARHGVPTDIALRLVAQESSFNPSADSGMAHGLMQITPATARLYGVEDVKSLSPEENIELGFRILSDNFKRYGNWRDAVSAYHSGVSLAEAARQNRNDGNMDTVDYVRGIAG